MENQKSEWHNSDAMAAMYNAKYREAKVEDE